MNVKLIGHEYIQKTREYLNYLEEHFINIDKAFELVCMKLAGHYLIYDDFNYHNLKSMIERHDLSKFSKEEFTQYRSYYYPTNHEVNILKNEDLRQFYLDSAWSYHRFKNDHHALYINNLKNKFPKFPYPTPHYEAYCVMHMAIDLIAMSFKFKDNPHEYYLKNKSEFNLDEPNDALIRYIFKECGFTVEE